MPDRGQDLVDVRARDLGGRHLADALRPPLLRETFAETGTTKQVILHVYTPIGGEDIYRATDTYPADSYGAETETGVLCTGDRLIVY